MTYMQNRTADLTGVSWGRLTVVGPAGLDKYSNRKWECRCSCGKTITLITSRINRRDTESCGCLAKEKTIERSQARGAHNAVDLTGQVFGRLTVVEKQGVDRHGHNAWTCQCACGNAVPVITSNLRRGVSSSCGCLRNQKSGERSKARGTKAREQLPMKKDKKTVRVSDTARLLHPAIAITSLPRVLPPVITLGPRDCESLTSLSLAERRGRLAWDRFDICVDSAGYFVKRVGEPLPEGAKVKERHMKRNNGSWDIQYANFGKAGAR